MAKEWESSRALPPPPRKGGGEGCYGSTATLSSAATSLRRSAAGLRRGQRVHRLGNSGVDTNRVVEVLLRRPSLHCHSNTLQHLPGVGAGDVEPDDPLILRLVHDHLDVACVRGALRDGPLEGDEVRVVDLDVLLPEELHGILLRVTAHPVLEGSEDCRRDILVVHELPPLPVQARCQQLPRLDSHWGELQPTLDDIPNGVDVGHAGALVLVDKNLAALRQPHPGVLQTDARVGNPPHREQHSVALEGLPVAQPDQQLPVRLPLLDLRRGRPADEVRALLFHVLAHQLRHLLVEPTEWDGPHEHRGVVPHPGEEPCALQRDVAGAHHEGLPGRLRQREDVVRRDAVLLRPRDVRVVRATAHGQDNTPRGDDLLLPLLVRALHAVRVDQSPQRVLVLDIPLAELGHRPEVELLDVHLHVVLQGLPVQRGGSVGRAAEGPGALRPLAGKRSGVEELLRDAPHVDARPTEAPRGAVRRWLDVVKAHHTGVARGLTLGGQEGGNGLRGGHPTRPSPDDNSIVVVPVVLLRLLRVDVPRARSAVVGLELLQETQCVITPSEERPVVGHKGAGVVLHSVLVGLGGHPLLVLRLRDVVRLVVQAPGVLLLEVRSVLQGLLVKPALYIP
eukprot:Sspe_Gene.31322::Locus_15465_Transcript_1_4_Confidence_0.286_Length_2249::g.31322::m.31322